jgi:epoxide hydrolase 4
VTQLDGVPVRHVQLQGAGVRLHAAVAGQGPLVLLLHGFPENWWSWRHQLPALARAGFTAAAIDLRGYGDSARPAARRAYHLRHLVDDVPAAIAALGHASAHLVGHDWGGIIAWTAAAEYPAVVSRLAILNAPHLRLYHQHLWRTSQFMRSWYAAAFQLPWVPERLLAARDFALVRRIFSAPALRHAFSDDDIERYIAPLRTPGALTAMLNYYRMLPGSGSRMASRAHVAAETLVLWGERDPALVPQLVEGIESLAPRATVHRMPALSHWIQNEAPDEVNRLLVDFLRRP